MKMGKKISIFVLCLVAVLGVVVGCGKTEKEENFVRETHVRDENISRNFEMLTLEDGSLRYHVEIAAKDKENDNLDSYKEQLSEIRTIVRRIEETAKKFSVEKENESLEIYFIENSTEGDICFYDGGIILIDKAFVTEEEFTSDFITLLYDCEQWVSYGMSRYIDEVEADEEFLKEHYSKEENIEDLSLFGGKFYELNTDEMETIHFPF